MHEQRVVELEERIAVLESIILRSSRIDEDRLYTPAEVAILLSCGKTNVYDLLTTGDLAVTRIGAGRRGLRVRGSDVLTFLDARKEGGPSPEVNYKHLGKYLR